MCKIDWSDAYKHIAVHAEDTDLQWFEWCGKGFKELCLIFGGVSSAGIFDRVNKILIHIALTLAKLDPGLICQVLDNCCAAAPEHSTLLEEFDRTFHELAKDIRIKLAPRDDPDKSFAPQQRGVILGIEYDTVNWTWCLPYENYIRLLHLIREVALSDNFRQEGIWSLTGKILNVKPLIPCGRFNINHLLRANSYSSDRATMAPISSSLRKQVHFWFSMLQGQGKDSLPDPDAALPPWAVNIFTDAAGGSSRSVGHRAGAVTEFWWAFGPWSKAINLGRAGPNKKSLARSMSARSMSASTLVRLSVVQKCCCQNLG